METPIEQKEEKSHGSLVVWVTKARGSLPIEGARVTIKSSEESEDLLYTLTTDRSGRTEKLSLPTPPAGDSQAPGGRNVYAAYDIEVTRDGYYTGMFFGVPVFAGVTSVQPVSLVPLAAYDPMGNRPDIGLDFEESEGLTP